jgi:hypothetical protein
MNGRKSLAVLMLVVVAVLAACNNTVAPVEQVHIVTAKSAVLVLDNTTGKLVPNPQHILLDQSSNWCSVSSAAVLAGFAIGDTVPAGTCLWYGTTAPQ